MDICSKVILAMAVLNVVVAAGWMIYLVAQNKKEFGSIVALNNSVSCGEHWQALVHAEQEKYNDQCQAMRELNADFSAIIEGE